MKQGEFCRIRGLSWDTLNRNLKKQRNKQSVIRPESRLVRVRLAGRKRVGKNDSSGLAVVLESGRRIEVGPGFDVHMLEQLVQVLERV